MDAAALRSHIARRWWVVALVAALTVLGAATAVTSASGEHRTTMEFVMRPDASVSNDDLPGTLEALKPEGALVQTVTAALGSRAMLERAAARTGLALDSDYQLTSAARPGSALIESTVTGPDRQLVDRLAAGYTRAASNYISASYGAYVLERLSADPTDEGTGPSIAQVILLALLLGAALGVALVAAELRFQRQLRPVFATIGGAQTPPSASNGSDRVGRVAHEVVREPRARAQRSALRGRWSRAAERLFEPKTSPEPVDPADAILAEPVSPQRQSRPDPAASPRWDVVEAPVTLEPGAAPEPTSARDRDGQPSIEAPPDPEPATKPAARAATGARAKSSTRPKGASRAKSRGPRKRSAPDQQDAPAAPDAAAEHEPPTTPGGAERAARRRRAPTRREDNG